MFPQFKTILVATDFSQTSEHALEHARALAISFGGRLHLLHVVPDPMIASARISIGASAENSAVVPTAVHAG